MEEKIDYKEIINKIRPELDKVISYLEKELMKIRTGRASPALVFLTRTPSSYDSALGPFLC